MRIILSIVLATGLLYFSGAADLIQQTVRAGQKITATLEKTAERSNDGVK